MGVTYKKRGVPSVTPLLSTSCGHAMQDIMVSVHQPPTSSLTWVASLYRMVSTRNPVA